MTIGECERRARERLDEAGVDSPGLCARLIVAHAADLAGVGYILAHNEQLAPEKVLLVDDLLQRRARGEPLAYLLGKKEFYKSVFRVDARVLIPRPETELVLELALSRLPENRIFFADVGCGCGCIGLSLLRERENWQGFLLDNSCAALEVAAANAKNISPRATLLAADLFCLPFGNESLDLVISNPPYIAKNEVAQVMPDVLAFEPHAALFSANGGLAHIEALAVQARRVLRHGGLLVIEHGSTQSAAVLKILLDNNFSCCENYQDLSGLPRCALARKS